MNGKASSPTHPHAPRRRRHVVVRRHDERVSPFVREIVVLHDEHGKLDGAKVLTDLGEREPADLDEAEEAIGREQAVVLVRVAHVPVGRNGRWHEHLEGLARVGHRLVGKAGCRLDDGEVRRNLRWDGSDGFGRMVR